MQVASLESIVVPQADGVSAGPGIRCDGDHPISHRPHRRSDNGRVVDALVRRQVLQDWVKAVSESGSHMGELERALEEGLARGSVVLLKVADITVGQLVAEVTAMSYRLSTVV